MVTSGCLLSIINLCILFHAEIGNNWCKRKYVIFALKIKMLFKIRVGFKIFTMICIVSTPISKMNTDAKIIEVKILTNWMIKKKVLNAGLL